MSIGELFIELGVVGNPEQVEKFNKKIKETAKSMDLTLKSTIKANGGLQDLEKGFKAFTTALKTSAIIGVIKTIDTLTQSLVSSNQTMLNLMRTSDISLKTFQKWNSIGRMFGVQNAAQQIEGLNQRLFQLRLTGEGAGGFQIAGINPIGQDAEGVLEQLRQRIRGLDDTSASWLLQQMGIDPQMLHILRMTREEFEALNNTIKQYQLTDKQRKSIQAMNVQLQIAGIKLKYLKDKAIMALMPAWTQFMHSLARVTEGLEIAVKWVSDLISKSPQLQSALKGVAAALAVILAITHPLWAAFIGLYLIIDDIVGYFQGKDSLIGVFINYLDDLQNKINNSIDTPQWIKDLLALIGSVDKLDKLNETIANIKSGGNKKVNLFDTGGNILGGMNFKGQEHFARNLGLALGELIRQSITGNTADGTVTGEAAPIRGYTGNLPNLDNMFISPAMQHNISNSSTTTNTDNRQINQNNYITTTQPAFDIERELRYANMAFA